MERIIICTLASLFIVSVESFMWWRFETRHQGIAFPHEVDRSFFGFLTTWRVRLLVFMHTTLVAGFICLTLWYLW